MNSRVAIVLLVAAGLVLAACGSREPDRYDVREVAYGPLTDIVTATGTVSVGQRIEVISTIPGRIEAVLVEPGQRVRKGQELARLDPVVAANGLAQALAERRAAEFAVSRAELRADQLRATLETQKKLVAGGFVASSALAVHDMELRQQTEAVKEARERVKSLSVAYDARALEVASTSIRAPIDGVVITSNLRVGQFVSTGPNTDSAGVAQPLAVIADTLDRVVVDAEIAEQDLARVRQSMAARLSVDAYPGEVFAGAVERVSIEAQRRGAAVYYVARVVARNVGGRMRPGMTVTVELVNTDVKRALVIPTDALYFIPEDYRPDLPDKVVKGALRNGRDPDSVQWDALEFGFLIGQGMNRVFVLEGGKPRMRSIVLGAEAGNMLEVKSGLRPGDRIIVRAKALAKPGR